MSDKPIKFSLRQITTEQFAMIGKAPSLKDKILVNAVSKFAYNYKARSVGVFFLFELISENKTFLVVEVGCHFEIFPQDWKILINEDDESITLPHGFASHLLMVTVGTARGILHIKTENTPFNKFHIPLLNVSEMIRSDVHIKNDTPSVVENV